METGGRDDHVRRTRSLSRRALGGDRDPGRLHRLRPRRAHPRDAGRQSSPAAGRRRVLSRHRHLDHAFRRHAGGAVAGGHRLSGAADHRLVPDLRAGGRHFAVLRQHRRAVAAARGVLGGAARGRHRQHALCRHARVVGQFRDDARRRDGRAVGADRDRHRLWRPARVPGAAGRRAARAERGRLRLCGVGHALHRDGRHASRSAGAGDRTIMSTGWPRRRKCCRWSWRCSAS